MEACWLDYQLLLRAERKLAISPCKYFAQDFRRRRNGGCVPFQRPSLAHPALVPGASHSKQPPFLRQLVHGFIRMLRPIISIQARKNIRGTDTLFRLYGLLKHDLSLRALLFLISRQYLDKAVQGGCGVPLPGPSAAGKPQPSVHGRIHRVSWKGHSITTDNVPDCLR